MTDASSGRIIRSYYIQGTSYTLSREMLRSLSSDCRLNFNIGGGFWSNDGFSVYIPWCVPSYNGGYHGGYDPYPYNPRPYGRVTYEWSNAGNCKRMIDGVYSGQNVDDSYCGGRYNGGYGSGRDRITYEWSNAGNCKKMINGQYSGQNVSDSYCGGRYNGGGRSGSRDRITYEWSNAGNCKKMINGQYSGQNVSKSYCR